MNRETLEHLIVDRQLGELSEDVSSLLDAYMQASPDARAEVQEVETTLSLAKDILHASSQDNVPLPAFPASQVSRELEKPSHQFHQSWKKPLALAAALALGVFLGAKTSSSTSPSSTQSIPVAFNDHDAGAVPQSDFWSFNQRRLQSTHSASTKPVEWTSPLHWPVKGESL